MSIAWLAVAYACSGAAGLVYEVTWTRLLTLHLGHTTAAASTVTATFMGGLCAGAIGGGRLAERLNSRHALIAYALLEVLVATAALAIVPLLDLLAPLFAWAYGERGAGALFPIVRLAGSAALLVVPAVGLGATFPLIVRAAAGSSARRGHLAGHLYAANTTGAALGSLAAGFLLLPTLGMSGTTLAGVVASGVSIVVALMLSRGMPGDEQELSGSAADADLHQQASTPVASPAGHTRASRRGQRTRTSDRRERNIAPPGASIEGGRFQLAAALLALTGLATFIHEIAWSRVLAMVLGPSTYAFAATLTSFITGLALGSFAGAMVADRNRRPAVALAVVLTITAALACISIGLVGGPLLEFTAAADANAGLADLARPQLGIALGLTLPIAFGLGVAFPLALQLAGGRDALSPRRLGALYAINTGAAVLGALLAGFVTIPVAGLRASLLIGTASLVAAASLAAVRGQGTMRGRAALLVPVAAVLVWMVVSPTWDHERLAAGGYLYTRFVPAGSERDAALTAGSLLYYREGATGAVSVKALTGVRSLVIDGKVDASTAGDMLTQKLLAHLPLLLHPNPRRVGIVGLGSGVTLASALVHPVTAVDVVEISPEVVEASAYFLAENRGALADPRTQLVLGDGRSHLSLSSRRYDVIISEPSNPWMAGVAALFTREFFQHVRDRLAPAGIFCQWAHTYDVSTEDLHSVAATFRSVFPDGTLWLVGDSDLLFVGAGAPLDTRLDGVAAAWRRPGVAEDLRGASVYEPFSLLSLYAGGPAELARLAGRAPVQTDDRMALEFSAPVAMLRGARQTHAAAIRALLAREQRPAPLAHMIDAATAAEWHHRAAMFMDAQAFEPAYVDYVAALRLAPTDAEALDGLVRAAIAARRIPDAEAQLRSIAGAHAAAARPRVALARLLVSRGRFDDAVAAATEATALAADDPVAWEQLVSLHADRGDGAPMAPIVEVLVRQFPERAASWYFAATARFLRGEVDTALPLVERAISLDAGYADAYNLLGAIRGTMGDIDAARDAFRTSLRLDPRDSVTYANLAQLELAANRRELASDLFAEALSLDPASADAREGLALAAGL